MYLYLYLRYISKVSSPTLGHCKKVKVLTVGLTTATPTETSTREDGTGGGEMAPGWSGTSERTGEEHIFSNANTVENSYCDHLLVTKI